MKISIGPELTERQAQQREATYAAAEILRAAGIQCEVFDLMAGERFPKSDSAMITVGPFAPRSGS